MPLYEYRCRQCDQPFEKYARTFSEPAACPGCGGADVIRLLSAFAVSTRSGGTGGPPAFGGCGEGPPCGSSQCGRLPN